MALQLLAQYPDFDRSEFDAHAESRGRAGLTLLQLWQAKDDSGHWALFSVNDRDKASEWLKREAALGHGPAAHHFLATA